MKRSPARIHYLAPPSRQRGVALAIGLLFLVLVTLLATVAMRQSITQERMAGGLRNVSLARNGAESALRAGERQIFNYYLRSNGRTLVGDRNASQRVYLTKDTRASTFRDYRGYTTTNAQSYPSGWMDFTSSGNGTASLSNQPVYLIADLGRVRPPGAGTAGEGGSTGTENYSGQAGNASPEQDRMFRITARSTGGLSTVVRAAESTYSGRARG